MQGTSTVKHCQDCNKNVYNLSLLTRAEANNLIIEKEGKLCVQLYKRFDGTVLTADCPKGLRAIKIRYIQARVKAIAFAVTLAGFLGISLNSCNNSVSVTGDPVANYQDSTHHG